MSEKIPVDTAIGNAKTHSIFISHNLMKPTVNTPQDQAFYRHVTTNVEIFRQHVGNQDWILALSLTQDLI